MSGGRALLAASVISIQNSCFIYPACQSCFSRLILDSRRFNCLKCGCTGEAKDASYRYRLSLKVADTNDLFDITVFGSCLDPFFGVAAGNLQRYIQDFNQLSGETNKDASPGVLVQAVETCFIGKRFIFGVKGCVSQDGGHSVASSILQNCSRINRSTKNLTACQIFLPNTAVTGFTVISYFHRLLQSAKIRSCNSSSCLPNASSAATDEPVSELSSLSGLSRSSCFVESSGRESFLGSWQQSFSLTSSVAWVTADFSSLEMEKLMSRQNEEEERPVSAESCTVSLNNQTLWDSQFCSSSLRKGNKKEEDELSSQSNQTNSISAPDKLEPISSSKAECLFDNSSRLLQNLLELGVKNTYPENSSGNDSCPEKSHNSLFYKRHTSPSNHVNVAGVSPTDSILWDELPFSESLNEFLARIEDCKSVAASPNLDTGKHALVESSKLDRNIIESSPRQALVPGNLHEVSILGKFLSPVEKDSWESIPLTCFQSNLSPPSDEVLQCESFCSALSLTTKECGASFFIPSPHQLIPSQSLPPTSEPSPSKSRVVQSKEANIGISKSACSFIGLQCTAEHRKTLCLQRSKTAACVQSAHDSSSVDWENKENYYNTPSQKTDLTCLGAWDSDSATPNKTRTYKRELKPLTELQENTFRSINKREMLWNSGCPEGSYNASADLFDASARELAKTVEFLNKTRNSSLQEDALTEKGTAELVLNPVDVPCNNSKHRSFLHRSPPAYSTPVNYSFCDAECNSVSAQDFVPYSQSTPVAKPLQKIRPVGERSSFVTIFTPKNLPKIHSKCKQSRPSFQNTLLQQLTGRSVKRERPSNWEDKESNSSVSQQSLIKSQLPEDDFEEWIPPSTNKRLKPAASLNFQTVSSAADLQSTCKYTDRNPTSERKFNSGNTCFRSEKLSPGNTARILTTPVSAGIAKALFLNDTVLESCSASEGKNHLSCASYSGGILQGTADWSPELFFQAQSPFFHK
ncbi:DNA damage-induced apoptosis suppressor protein isoform X2 [Dromaius novaehollandiae]|uniref:DNA damage-induced apoptosis suppressor protein isoform X2 n=1 Tax=Dromaius novaehollandiae TaxID=8790 RepID=UPI00311E3FAB